MSIISKSVLECSVSSEEPNVSLQPAVSQAGKKRLSLLWLFTVEPWLSQVDALCEETKRSFYCRSILLCVESVVIDGQRDYIMRMKGNTNMQLSEEETKKYKID